MDPVPIPGPAPLPLIGNIRDVDAKDAIGSLGRLAETYGEIFKLTIGGHEKIFVSSVALLNEVCDESRFTKAVAGALAQIRNGVEDGLFTAYHGEHNWEVAHRTLMPAFGPLRIRDMFDEMHDIASQLVIKWARFGGKEKIDVTSDFTKLTLDSIALCAMDTRFNSFYQDDLHPFVESMVGLLQESGARARRPALTNYLMFSSQRKYDEDIALLKKVAADCVADRRNNPSDKKDLLNTILTGRDPKTGEGLTEASIINNMITFLIAGHETTSGLLSFLFYFLIKNPEAYQKAQKEVDEVLGRGPLRFEHLSQLQYITACLRETLRLTPTAPAFTLQPLPETKDYPVMIGGGKYEIKEGQPILALLSQIHRDPAVYGNDANDFRPERMLDDPFSKLPPNSWKPFGNGVRGCIGRPFAWQESLMATALLLQIFNFRFNDPGYTLAIKQTLTIKPRDFYIHATLRDHVDPVNLEKMLHSGASMGGEPFKEDQHTTSEAATSDSKMESMAILYGSNAGTCEALARSLARTAGTRGYKVSVDTLDTAVNKVPTGQPVVLISSSYEGQPPDNASHFVAWLGSLKNSKALEGVKYAVYGCGNHDWVSTFHKIPKGLDTSFSSHGAIRLAETGLGDVAQGDIFNDFDKWQEEVFFPALGDTNKDTEAADSGIDIELDTDSRRSTLRQNVYEAVVISNEVLTSPGVPERRHIKLKLPSGMTYRAGEYLTVLPLNNTANIRRALKRYGLPWDAILSIKAGSNTTLPTEHPMSATDVLGAYVELSQSATKRNIQHIAASIANQIRRLEVLRFAEEDFEKEIKEKRRSPLDILEAYPDAALPLSSFFGMLPPMRTRQYSISSSPLADSSTASLTWTVLDTPSAVAGGKRFLGVASNYLSHVEQGDIVHVAVKSSHGNFHLPADIENTPVIMLCAGSGLAPFIGFVEERAIQKAAGRKLAPAYLFIGCAYPKADRIFADKLDRWTAEGVVKVYYAHSRARESSKGCKYVQDRLWVEREEMKTAFANGAKIYICGNAKVGEGVAAKIKEIYREAAHAAGKEKMDEQVEEWFNKFKSDRYASDVFL